MLRKIRFGQLHGVVCGRHASAPGDPRDRAAAALAKQGYIPAELYERVSAMLEKYRAAKATGTADVASAR
jgi:hypothetical protein